MNVLGISAYTDHEALTNFIEAIRVAESACSQLALYTEKQEWLMVRLGLENIRETAINMAQSSMLGGVR